MEKVAKLFDNINSYVRGFADANGWTVLTSNEGVSFDTGEGEIIEINFCVSDKNTEPEAPTKWTLTLVDPGSRLIPVIKHVRAATHLGLKEAKDLVDKSRNSPTRILSGESYEMVNKWAIELQAEGAQVQIDPIGGTHNSIAQTKLALVRAVNELSDQ